MSSADLHFEKVDAGGVHGNVSDPSLAEPPKKWVSRYWVLSGAKPN